MTSWQLRNRGEDEANPRFGFGTRSSAATATSPYSMNPSSTGEDSAAQGSGRRIVDFNLDNSSGLDWMRATTDEIDRATWQSINTYNSPQFQRMLDNQTARSRSADSYQDQRSRGNATFSNQMQRQNQSIAASRQSQMTRQQMGWAQDIALGGQPGDGRRRGSTIVSTERQYSPFQTFMGNASIIGNLGGFYATQSADRANERQASLQGASMMMDDRFRNNQLALQADSIGLDDRFRNNQLQLQTDSVGLDDRFRNNQLALQANSVGLDDRYRNRTLAIDAIMRANQRSLWSSPLEQIALNQARQPGMVR